MPRKAHATARAALRFAHRAADERGVLFTAVEGSRRIHREDRQQAISPQIRYRLTTAFESLTNRDVMPRRGVADARHSNYEAIQQ